MDKFEHLLITLAIQLGIGALTDNWWVGGLFAAGLFIGREQAQAEYRWIATSGGGNRVLLRWFYAFEPKLWNTHNFFWNLVLPISAAAAIALYFAQ